MKRIRFKIDKDGEVKLEVEGAVGEECDAMTEPFEDALGIVTAKERKAAFYAEAVQAEQEIGS